VHRARVDVPHAQVHDVMGLSLKDQPSVFQLESHDRSRHRYGVILLAFRFDPPVAADVFGEFDGTTAVGPVAVVSEQAFQKYVAGNTLYDGFDIG